MLRLSLLLILTAFSLMAEEHALVSVKDIWKFVAATNGVEPKPNWIEADYDDSKWMQGWPSYSSSFTIPEGTFLQAGGITNYVFRRTFNLIDPGFVRWLTLRLEWEHAFVAYINGVEVARRGFPEYEGMAVPLGVAATNAHDRPRPELIDISQSAPLLRAGKNALAIQMHSSTNRHGITMVGELLANFSRGPFVQNMTTNSTQLIWQTQVPATGFVAYGKTQESVDAVFATTMDTNQVVTLAGLEPNTTYHYRVYIERQGTIAASDWFSFRTLKMPGTPVTIIVMGDSGQGTIGQHKIASRLEETPADLILHSGDITYPWFHPWIVDQRFFGYYRPMMRSVPFFFTIGNHDGLFGEGFFLNTFYLPTNSVTGTEHYYSFDHGDAHIVALAVDTVLGHRYTPDSLMYQWLEADLAASRQRWKFIFFHHVMRSSSLHSADDYLFDGTQDKFQLQATIGHLAEKYGVQIVFNGHDHAYERFAAVGGVNSIISGGGGASLYGQYTLEPGSLQFHQRFHFVRVSIDGPDLVLEAIDDDGRVLDRFYRSESGADTRSPNSIWGGAVVEPVAGSDTAGNIPGQTFDFNGPSIRTKAGNFANLGRVHVRNDRTHLYVGFESIALWENQSVALFIESSAEPGVTEIAPLGNGIMDESAGEGVDGLDLLTGLRFRDFAPSIACLLGDEMADGSFRNLKRPAMRYPTGQGVFHLDQTFSTVAGARLQQFNRSPQGPPTKFAESDADFIEVAIPLNELGNVRAPGFVKLGAVAVQDPGEGRPMVPQIDTAFLGKGLEPSEGGGFTLEPITVALAPNPDPNADGYEFFGVLAPDNKIRFTWNATPGKTYTIEATRALGEAWEPLVAEGLPIIAAGRVLSFDYPMPGGEQTRFFRLAER